MPALLAPFQSAAQLARVLTSPRNILLIHCYDGRLTGNALGLALAAQGSPDFALVVLCHRDSQPQIEIPRWWHKGRIASLLLKRADVVAYTGRCLAGLAHSPHRLRLLLWHGMPIKGIGKFDPLAAGRGAEPCDLAIATSKRTAEIMAQSFSIAAEKFVITGEPKTDPLPTDRPGWDWVTSLRVKYRTIVGYFPTWRETFETTAGKSRRRSDAEALGQLVRQLTGDEALRQGLESHAAAFVIRAHPKLAASLASLSPPFFAMGDAEGDATHLLQDCDIVIGDYSSVVIDALLFDRPLALWCEDLDRYTAQRPLPYFDFGKTFGWAIRPTLFDLREWLVARLDGYPSTPTETQGFTRARALFHAHGRGGAGDRVLQALRERLLSR
jgi:CDP-Glycerol:Poly(glycerophosphate) glycerophosphotransferase